MPRINPSDVVRHIDVLLPNAPAWQNDPQRWRMQLDKGHAGMLLGVVQLVKQVDEALLPGGSERVHLIAAIGAVEARLAIWSGGGSGEVEKTPGVGDINPVLVIRKVMEKLPDDVVPPAARRLGFIADPAYRESLERDLVDVARHLREEEWKAAMVIGGSLVEALLLDAILKETPATVTGAVQAIVSRGEMNNPGADPLWWHLPNYIRVAHELKLFKDRTRDIALAAGDARNLIHPGRAIRQAEAPTKAKAFAVAAALEAVIEDLT